MPRRLPWTILLAAAAACGGSSHSRPGGGGSSTTTAGWQPVLESGGQVLQDPGFTGGAPGGATAGPHAVAFLDADRGWSVGNLGEILETTDAGQTGTEVASPTSATLRAVFPVSATELWIAGDDATGASIWRSTNGGASWHLEVSTSSIQSGRTGVYLDRVSAILATPSGAAVAVGTLGGSAYLILLRDTNGQWYELDDFSTGTGDALSGLAAVAGNPLDLVAVGNEGLVLVSTDGGSHWSAPVSGTAQPLYRVACAAAGQTCVAVGASGTAVLTQDGGTSWSGLTTGTANDLYAVAFSPSSTTFWAGGSNGLILRTRNLGATWQTQTTHISSWPVLDLCMTSETSGWAAAAYDASNSGALLMTDTGGDG